MLTLALGFGMSVAVFAQDDVPAVVKSDFESTFSNATNVEWKAKDGSYYAMFEMENHKHYVEYNADGSIEKTGREIEVTELPKPVMDAMNQQYADLPIEKVKTIEKDGKTMYMAKFKGGEEDMKVIFNADGSIVKEKEKDKYKNKEKKKY